MCFVFLFLNLAFTHVFSGLCDALKLWTSCMQANFSRLYAQMCVTQGFYVSFTF